MHYEKNGYSMKEIQKTRKNRRGEELELLPRKINV